jgi:hypothetical protein
VVIAASQSRFPGVESEVPGRIPQLSRCGIAPLRVTPNVIKRFDGKKRIATSLLC